MIRTLQSCGLVCLTLCLAGNAGSALAQSRTGTTAATFLTLGAGARGQALGHAYTAMASGADALFWNPAGAARGYSGLDRGGVMLSHARWFADIDFNAAAVVIPAGGTRVLGLSVAAVNYGDMKVRTVALPEGTGETFGATDFSLGLTYAPTADDIVLFRRHRQVQSDNRFAT